MLPTCVKYPPTFSLSLYSSFSFPACAAAAAVNVHRYLNLFCSRGDDRRVSRFKARVACQLHVTICSSRKLFPARHVSQPLSSVPCSCPPAWSIDKCVSPSSLHRLSVAVTWGWRSILDHKTWSVRFVKLVTVESASWNTYQVALVNSTAVWKVADQIEDCRSRWARSRMSFFA